MQRPALVATLVIVLAACESAAPVAPAAPDGHRALFAASGAGGVCNAVFAQLEHRGTVEEHVLAAAARQNAEVIQQLEAERKKLESMRLTAEKNLAELDAQIAKATARQRVEIEKLETELARETDPELRAKLEDRLQKARAELATIEESFRPEREKVLAEIAKIDARIAEIDAQLARGGC